MGAKNLSFRTLSEAKAIESVQVFKSEFCVPTFCQRFPFIAVVVMW